MTPIDNITHLREVIHDGAWAHGGYPKFYVTADGGVLSHTAVRQNLGTVAYATRRPGCDPQWEVVAYSVNLEDTTLYCDHTGERIPSAYNEDEAADQLNHGGGPWAELRAAGLVPAGQTQ